MRVSPARVFPRPGQPPRDRTQPQRLPEVRQTHSRPGRPSPGARTRPPEKQAALTRNEGLPRPPLRETNAESEEDAGGPGARAARADHDARAAPQLSLTSRVPADSAQKQGSSHNSCQGPGVRRRGVGNRTGKSVAERVKAFGRRGQP